jgi:hypothetical protein
MKPANKAEQSAAESVERRAGTKGNADQQSTLARRSALMGLACERRLMPAQLRYDLNTVIIGSGRRYQWE